MPTIGFDDDAERDRYNAAMKRYQAQQRALRRVQRSLARKGYTVITSEQFKRLITRGESEQHDD